MMISTSYRAIITESGDRAQRRLYSPGSHPAWTFAIKETEIPSVNDGNGVMFLDELIQLPEISPDIRNTENTPGSGIDDAVEQVEWRLETSVWSLRGCCGGHGLS